MRQVTFDFREGNGSLPMFGRVELSPAVVHEVGTATVVTAATKAELASGQATLQAEPGDYLVRVYGYRHGGWGWRLTVPEGTAPITFTEMS